MSVGLLIKEGQVGRKILPVEKLKINNIGGGESYWVPEETTEVDSLDVSENGLYYAINDDLDGYDQVNVNVPPDMDENGIAKGSKITGTGDDGNDYAYGLDENDEGDKVITVEQIPAAIHIVVPPRKLKYEDGETIDFTGIHVYLMNGNNQRYTDEDYPTGEIPFDELVFPVTVANKEGKRATSGFDEIQNLMPISVFSGASLFKFKNVQYGRKYFSAGTYACFYRSQQGITYIPASVGPEEYRYFNPPSSWDKDNDPKSIGDYSENSLKGETESNFTYNGKTVYYSSVGVGASGELYDQTGDFQEVQESIGSEDAKYIAWTIIYGDITSKIKIPVQWIRSDGEILEDTFEIEIGESEPPLPPQPDPWGGYADVSWGGHHYNLNRRIVPEVHYANGYLWQDGISTEYNVEQAASMGWLILIR